MKFRISVRSAGRNLGTERSEIVKLAKFEIKGKTGQAAVAVSVSVLSLSTSTSRSRGETNMSVSMIYSGLSTRTLTSRYRHPQPRQYYISLPPTPLISYYSNFTENLRGGKSTK